MWTLNYRLSPLFLALVLGGCADEQAPETQDATPPDAAAANNGAPADHVSFFVVGKSWHFDQDYAGELDMIDMGFFAEVFKTADGEVDNAFMQLQAPGSEPIPFDREGDNGAVLYGHDGNRHQAIEDVDAELPNGDYAFRFSTPAGDIEDYVVTITGPDGRTDLPPAPAIALEQNGAVTAGNAIEAGADVRVSWTPFATGRADPNGIADDLIFVMMQDCHGRRAFHSGRPLNTPNPLEPDKPSESVLIFSDNEVTIPGSAFTPGMRYTLDVEHARLLDTDNQHGIVGMTTYAVTTHLPIQVQGATDDNACPEN